MLVGCRISGGGGMFGVSLSNWRSFVVESGPRQILLSWHNRILLCHNRILIFQNKTSHVDLTSQQNDANLRMYLLKHAANTRDQTAEEDGQLSSIPIAPKVHQPLLITKLTLIYLQHFIYLLFQMKFQRLRLCPKLARIQFPLKAVPLKIFAPNFCN